MWAPIGEAWKETHSGAGSSVGAAAFNPQHKVPGAMVTAPFLVQPLFTRSLESCLLHQKEQARVLSHGPHVSEDGRLAACPGHGLCVSEDGHLAACLGVFILSDTPQPELKMTSARGSTPYRVGVRVTHGGS